MRAPTQVLPDGLTGFRIHVVVDGELAGAHLHALPLVP